MSTKVAMTAADFLEHPTAENTTLQRIANKVEAGERISFDEGVFLDEQADFLTLGRLANLVRERKNGNYAFYAHLKPDSLKVKPGDQLKAGQVIAALGNSGNSDAPHLHFHVMDGPDPLASNGLPFVFKSFRLTSRLASQDSLQPLLDGKPAALQPGFAASDQSEVSPLVLDVMTYATS